MVTEKTQLSAISHLLVWWFAVSLSRTHSAVSFPQIPQIVCLFTQEAFKGLLLCATGRFDVAQTNLVPGLIAPGGRPIYASAYTSLPGEISFSRAQLGGCARAREMSALYGPVVSVEDKHLNKTRDPTLNRINLRPRNWDKFVQLFLTPNSGAAKSAC